MKIALAKGLIRMGEIPLILLDESKHDRMRKNVNSSQRQWHDGSGGPIQQACDTNIPAEQRKPGPLDGKPLRLRGRRLPQNLTIIKPAT